MSYLPATAIVRLVRRLIAILAVLSTSMLGVSASVASTSHPTLKLLSERPVVVAGQHFRARERIRLVPSTGPAVSVQASRAGSFTITLSRTFIGRCGGLSLRATGTRGSFASLKLPRPACLPY